MSIHTVGVIGAGTMGNGIAQACAVRGLKVVMVDINEAAVQRGLKTVAGSLDRLVKKEKISEADHAAAMARIQGSTSYDDLKGCDLVIEAVFENREIKAEVTKKAEAQLTAKGVFGSNTSTLPITGLSEASVRPENFVGIHFFSPVDKMALVEIITGKKTDLDIHQHVEEGASVVFPARRGETRLLTFAFLWKWGFVQDAVLSVQWLEGDERPLITLVGIPHGGI